MAGGATVRFRAVIPTGFGLNTSKLTTGLLGALNHSISIFDDDLKKTYATWMHKPAFDRERAHRVGGTLAASISTADKVYRIVDQGARPHVIVPRNAPRLVFRWGGPGSYTAKTRPGVISSGAGTDKSGQPLQRRKLVNHPGMAARNFTGTIATRKRRNAENLIRAAIQKALIPPERL